MNPTGPVPAAPFVVPAADSEHGGRERTAPRVGTAAMPDLPANVDPIAGRSGE